MSENKGKVGEARAMILCASLMTHEDDVDYIKPTKTNEADGGVDFRLTLPSEVAKKVHKIGSGDDLGLSKIPAKVSVRVDVKNTNRKISKPTARKFVNDMAKSPDDDVHILMGGNGCTKGAKEVLEDAQKAHGGGKQITHFNNAGINRLLEEYPVKEQLTQINEDDKKE